jgi:ABC-2 type transport system ATP-binding protein
MDEAQHLADRVAVIVDGRIVAEGPPESIGGREAGEAIVSFRLPLGAALADLPAGLPAPSVDDGVVALRTTEPTALLHTLTGWAIGRGEELPALSVTRPSLEDVYLRLAGDDAVEPAAMDTGVRK